MVGLFKQPGKTIQLFQQSYKFSSQEPLSQAPISIGKWKIEVLLLCFLPIRNIEGKNTHVYNQA